MAQTYVAVLSLVDALGLGIYAVVGAAVFVTLLLVELADIQAAAFIAIGSTFLLRVLAIRFDWRSPAMGWDEQG